MMIVSTYTPNISDKPLPDCDLIEHKPEELETFCKDWPKNREFYCTAQGGEFIKWIDNKGIICLIDADTTIQRHLTEEELEEILPSKGQFTACLNAYPAVLLYESKQWLLPTQDFYVNKQYKEISAAMIIAHYDDWVKMKQIYVPLFHEMKKKLLHHAMTQWLISWIIQKHFTLKIGPEWLHNAFWYRGTNSYLKNGELFIKEQKVVFNHTKWM